MNTIEITSVNYNGQTANVTFSADTGGIISIGYVTLPYQFTSDYIYGTYDLYFPIYGTHCYLVISETTTTTTTFYITPTPI